MSKETILMTENQWANSQFSIAKYYGGVRINGMAIPPGEPVDLVLVEWIPIYKKLGRDRFIEIIDTGVSLEEAKGIAGLKRKLNKED